MIERAHHLLELGALATELLSSLGVAPDAGLLELARYLLQAFVLFIVLKDTSSASRYALRDRRCIASID